ncbi:MAG: 50S ribosomal protein L15 [Proteobacteria bacterium]|nr:50S ribosomal protein L15 [Pseudomonadota bacterium]MDA1136496.1 50S ribosomal protein L15 [Pseudomonadota bacterium]
MKLNEIRDNKEATKNRKRIGRGIGSGTGKTSGQGHKGQKARSGVAIKGFEGGQMPIHRRLPKRGFTNIFRTTYTEINIDKIESLIKDKKIDPANIINAEQLFKVGLIKKIDEKIKLLGKGELISKINIEVSASSVSAKAHVEQNGGTVLISNKKKSDKIITEKSEA